MHIFVIGYPSHVGGADTELWHTTRLWRDSRHDVTFIPTWQPDPEWRQKLAAIGCDTVTSSPGRLSGVAGLAGSVVVSFCNDQFLRVAPELRQLGCRLLWVNCMTWPFDMELQFIREHGPFDRHVFHSMYQRTKLEPHYKPNGYDPTTHGVRIPGAFDVEAWQFAPRPHAKHEPFRVGRLARNDSDKWSSNTWPIYGRIQYPDVRAWLMGVDAKVFEKLGPPPHWATCLPPNEMPAVEFLKRLHALIPINGGAAENWPRVGLEAMAVGVPVIAQNQWGWREMITHGETGFLCDHDCEFAHWAAVLAHDEDLRLQIANNARQHLVQTLANPQRILAKWEGVFESLERHEDVQPIATTA